MEGSLLLIILILCFVQLFVRGQSQSVYAKVAPDLETPEWFEDDAYDTSRQKNPSDRKYIRYPHPEQVYKTTQINQELVILTDEDHEFIPSSADILRIGKTPRRFFGHYDYKPLKIRNHNSKQAFAEHLDLRRRNFGTSDESILPFLFLPTGWPMFLAAIFIPTILIVPLLGSFILHAGFHLATTYKYFIWNPLKLLLRALVIQQEEHGRRWRKFLAPDYFLEPRGTWKLPNFLRNDYLEDTPPELAHRPPINKIDYTMYILTQEDYDDLDLGMDELEFIDELLQFRERYPKSVAMLLKHKLGDEKFYYYFDEDVLSDDDWDEDEVMNTGEEEKQQPLQEKKSETFEEDDEALYLMVLETDEPWMHEEFDETYIGYNLEEIRKRRQMLRDLKQQIVYLHGIIQLGSEYDKNMEDLSEEKKRKLQHKAKKLIERFLRYSTLTKERIQELEPSLKAQQKHNPALSKYLPLINKMSHYNHRLNLKHEKHKEEDKRKMQLEVFGWP